MRLGHLVVTAILLGGVALPVLLPLVDLIRETHGWSALRDVGRIAALAATSLTLAAGTVLLAVPVGTLTALLLECYSLPTARLIRPVMAVGLFVPLPVYAAAWQALIGNNLLPDIGGWRPWRLGLIPAVWVHAMAAVPWVYWIVALGLRNNNPRLAEDAMLAGGPRAVLRWILWPKLRLAAVAAGCWVAVQTLTEVTVTDLMMVRTFGEEVYFQLVANPAGVSAAVAVSVPVWALSSVVAVGLLGRFVPALPANPAEPGRAPSLSLPASSAMLLALLLWASVVVLVALPIAGLIDRTGGALQLVRVVRVHGATLADSLLWSTVAGLVAASLALAACWAARTSASFGHGLLVLAAIVWVTPGPLLGLGLKQVIIDVLLPIEEAVCSGLGIDTEFPPLRSLLYDQPSPIPAVWVAVIRFFPVALAVVWPVVRGLPRDLLDAARLDGGTRAMWRGVVWPLTRPALVRAVIAVGALSLGEVVAGKLVQPPGRQSFIQETFNAMHYGADATVAAMSLVQIVATVLACAPFLTPFPRARIG